MLRSRNVILTLFIQRTNLRNDISQQLAEINTLKSVPSPPSVGRGSGRGAPGVCAFLPCPRLELTLVQNQNVNGLVQRLVQKEKQVLQLQADLDRYKAQNPTEGREAVSCASELGCLSN